MKYDKHMKMSELMESNYHLLGIVWRLGIDGSFSDRSVEDVCKRYGFDPDTFLYYEENILYKKLQTRSRTSYCTPLVKCTHLGAVSTQQMSTVFLKQCNLESADIYLSRYSRLTFTQRLAWKIAEKMWTVKLNSAAARQTN